MPEKVEGFLIADGRFFTTKEEADLEEARLILAHTAAQSIEITPANVEDFIAFIEKTPEIVYLFTDAIITYKNAQKTEKASAPEAAKMQEVVEL